MKISPVSSERLDGGTAGVLRGRGPSDSHRLTNGAFFEGIATKGALTQRRLTKSFLWFFFFYSSLPLCSSSFNSSESHFFSFLFRFVCLHVRNLIQTRQWKNNSLLWPLFFCKLANWMMKITLFLFQQTKVPFFQWKQCIKRNVQLLVPPFFPNFLLGMSMTAVKPVKQQTILSTTRKEKTCISSWSLKKIP